MTDPEKHLCIKCGRLAEKGQKLCIYCACDHDWDREENSAKCKKCGLMCYWGYIKAKPTKIGVIYD